MIFFYEILFVLVALIAVFVGEQWSRTVTLLFLLLWLGVVAVGYASFNARLAAGGGVPEADLQWYRDARDGLRHLRLLFGLAVAAAAVWRFVAG